MIMKKIINYSIAILFCMILTVGCSDENETPTGPPKISFEGDEPIFKVKVGQTLVITPTVENAGSDAIYMWKKDKKIISKESSLTYSSDEIGSIYVNLQVVTDYGTDERELRIDVMSLIAPEITMVVPETGFIVIVDGDLSFTPEVANAENAVFSWKVNGEAKSDKKDFTFNSAKSGDYKFAFSAKNEDGEDVLEFNVKVCTTDEMPFVWMWEQDIYNISIGRTAFIRSFWIKNAFNATYSWQVDGGNVVQQSAECLFAYKPETQGKHTVTVTMKNKYMQQSKTFTVNVCPPEGTYRRASTGSANADHGYFFLPAPAQHINRGAITPFNSQDEVNAYIYNRPGSTEYGGSIGSWGGYLVVGFDHSVANTGDYDLEIEGNAFKGWSEPGIVWVMQDENGNGLPDDTWYELKGSEYNKAGYIKDYAVTYYKGGARKAIAWEDNQGNSGTIDYIHDHTPPTLYPRWLSTESYTLVGSRLPSMARETSPGYWVSDNFEWGYVDNWSTVDMLSNSENPNANFAGNHMRISDAVTHEGKPAGLKYIDFVKIQTGANGKAGWLGEISTEVGAIRDFNMKK